MFPNLQHDVTRTVGFVLQILSAVILNWYVFMQITVWALWPENNVTIEPKERTCKTERGSVNAMFDRAGTVVPYQIKVSLKKTSKPQKIVHHLCEFVM